MKKAYCYILLFLYILINNNLQAQMQTAHWYFGFNSGLDFTSGSPVIDNNGQISTLEGCTSISDEYGNLLFYTDGRKVYNSIHNIMQNGTGLRGDNSSTTSAIVLPVPDNCNLYYIFTIDVQDVKVMYRPKRGIEYNIVDMSLNGGLGAVIEKNIEVPINGIQQGYEKLAAISNADKTGYWIVTFFEGNFYAFSVTGNGIDLNPIVSSSPNIQPSDIAWQWSDWSADIGYLKASPDGSKLAMGMTMEHCWDRYLTLYDFDNVTGVVSNEVVLYQPDPTSEVNKGFYGIEFSSNSKVLYATCHNSICENGIYTDADTGVWHEIWQYNLEAVPVADSKYVVATLYSLYNSIYALQRGLDGKIYNLGIAGSAAGQSEYIRVIENPDTVYNPVTGEAPVFNPEAIYFGEYTFPNNILGAGLPTFLNHYFRISIIINGLANTGIYCAGDVLDFGFCSQGGEIQSILWDFGDGNTSVEMYPSYIYNASGTYTVTVTLTVEGEEYVRTITFDITGPEGENALLEICDTGQTHTFHLTDALSQINPLNQNVNITFHLTEQDARNAENALSNEYAANTVTVIFIRIEDEDGCYIIRELSLVFNESPEIQTDTLVEICPGTSTVLIVDTAEENTVNWYASENDTTPIFTGNSYETPNLTAETSYWVEAVNPKGCLSERIEIKISIIIDQAPIFNLQQLYCINAQPEELPSVSDNGISGSWNPSVIDTSVLGIQTYVFTSEAGDCTQAYQLAFDIEVVETKTPEFNLTTEYFFGETPQTLPTISNNGISGSWYEPYINTTIPGKQNYAFIPNPGECAEVFLIEIKVINYPHFFTPNGDGINDYWNIWGFTDEHNAEILIFDRYGKLLKQLFPPGQGWDGKLHGNDLFASDYWFIATYNRNGKRKEVKGHFSLKR